MRVFVIAIFVLILSTNNVVAQDFMQKLKQLDNAGQREELFKALYNAKNQDDFGVALDFLKDKLWEQRTTDTDFHSVYAMLLWRAGIKDTSAGMAGAALLILQADQARCADKTAGHVRFTNRLTMFQDMLKYVADAPKDEQDLISNIALNMEKRISDRKPNRSLCYSGIKATQEALKYVEEQDMELEQSGKNSYVIPEFDHVNVAFVSDQEWHKERARIRSEFHKRFAAKK